MKIWGTLILIFSISGASFSHVILINPRGGEYYDPNEIVEISWEMTQDHPQNNWDLYYSVDGGFNWLELAIDLPTSQLSYSWTIPDVSTTSARIRIVMDNVAQNYQGISDDFNIDIYHPLILNFPMGGENFLIGSTQLVEWEVNGLVAFDFWNLMYSEDGGLNWLAVASNLPPATLSFDWQVPLDITATGQIRLQMNISGSIYEDVSRDFIVSDEVVTGIGSDQLAKNQELPYPNPFRYSVIIPITNSNTSFTAELHVYNKAGVEVFYTTITNTIDGSIIWTPKNLSSGIYYYQIQSHSGVDSGKLFYQK